MDSAQNIDLQVQNLEKKIESAGLPPDLLEKTRGMIGLLKITLKQGGNYTNFEGLANYLNIVSSIPFNQETKDILDLKHSAEVLDKNHYGLKDVKNRILEYLSTIILNLSTGTGNATRAPVICLVGLVGTGKTTLAKSVAD
jgi:ATP-dependent Lon protease